MKILLPEPKIKGKISVEEAIFKRRSYRKFKTEGLSKNEISQLLWAAYGRNKYHKVVPSAGAIYPYKIYVSLEDGIYEYNDERHAILKVIEGDKRKDLYYAALQQEWVKNAGVIIILAVDYEKITSIYGDRGIMYAHIEAGHIAQNVCLEAEALNLGSVCIGAFNEEEIKRILNLKNLNIVYMICVGKI